MFKNIKIKYHTLLSFCQSHVLILWIIIHLTEMVILRDTWQTIHKKLLLCVGHLLKLVIGIEIIKKVKFTIDFY